MAKKWTWLLSPLLLVLCFMLGYFSPMLGGAVYISTPFPAVPLPPIELSAVSTDVQSVKININTAEAGILDTLPGISLGVAQKIVAYRSQNHPFGSIEELQAVKGIGEKTYNKIRMLICTK